MPPLGLLPHLVAGRISPVMRGVTVMADRLRADLEQLLAEHEAIVAAVDRLKDAARDEDQMKYAHLAERLIAHARTEEQLIYPLVAGSNLRIRHDLPNTEALGASQGLFLWRAIPGSHARSEFSYAPGLIKVNWRAAVQGNMRSALT